MYLGMQSIPSGTLCLGAAGSEVQGSRDRQAAVDLKAALFCDEDCRNQASCTLHLTITNSICSLDARGPPLKHLPSSQHPREPR